MGDLVKLARGDIEFRAGPAERLLLTSIDVDLGVHGDLAKPQENREALELVGDTIQGFCRAPLRLDVVEDTIVDGLLVLISKVEILDLGNGRGGHREAGRRFSLFNRPGKVDMGNPIPEVARPTGSLNSEADELQVGHNIVELIDDGRRSKSPLVGSLDLEDRCARCGLCVADAVGLVEDNAVEGDTGKQARGRHDLLVVADVDRLTADDALSKTDPPILLGREDVHGRLSSSLNPLLLYGQGRHNQGALSLTIHDKSQGLDGLSEPHFIAEDTATHGIVFNNAIALHQEANLLLVEHPLDPLDLVFGVNRTGPSGFELHC